MLAFNLGREGTRSDLALLAFERQPLNFRDAIYENAFELLTSSAFEEVGQLVVVALTV